MRKWLFALVIMLLAGLASAQQAATSPIGRWRTIDDTTGRPKSVVEIYQASNGAMQGRVVEILQSDRGPNPTCDNCPGEARGKPVRGLTILWGLRPDGANRWSGGRILDPAKGKVYSARITLIENGQKLEVRGYMGIEALGRTQTWVRMP